TGDYATDCRAVGTRQVYSAIRMLASRVCPCEPPRSGYGGRTMADETATTAQDQGTPQEAAQTSALRERASELGTQVREHAQALGAQVQERAQEIGTQVRDWAHEVGDQLTAGAQEAKHQAEVSASQLAAQGREAVGQLEKSLEDYIRAKPLQSIMIAAGGGGDGGVRWVRIHRD